MAEEKKPKIDLKARLGKKTVSAPSGPSIPPPVGLHRPVPAPPFAQPSGPSRPKVDASNPYAAITADQAPEQTKPQAIKVELSEEVVAAQRKGKLLYVALAAIGAVVGGLLGFTAGGGSERSKQATLAVKGAGDLVDDIEKANTTIEELAETLKNAREKLQSNKYPADEVQKLGGIDIPFSGANLTDKGIGRFKADVVNLLIEFASGSKEANDGKDKVRNVLAGAKAPIEDFLAQQTTPKVRWSVYFENGPHGPWASMQPLPTPFLVKQEKKDPKDTKQYKWPADFKIKQGDKEFTLKRYESGDPTKAKAGEPFIVPVNPETQGAVCPSDVATKLQREISALEAILRGDKSDPTDEKAGLIDTGKALVDKLKGIGRP
jgi:uncharacterized protein YcfJ